MKPVKRVEIIIGSVIMPVVIRQLTAAGFVHFTHIRHANGKGHYFNRSGDDVTDVFAVDVLILAVDPDLLTNLTTSVEPLIDTYGGICLISDARMLAKGYQ